MTDEVFSDAERRAIAELSDAATAPIEPARARCIMPSDADERFDSVEVFERRDGRLYRRGESAGQ